MQHLRLILTLGLLLGGASGGAASESRQAVLHSPPSAGAASRLSATAGTSPPIGYVRFCSDNGADCAAQGDMVFQVTLDAQHEAELREVNDRLNTAIEPVTDLEHFGETERWSYPADGKGDCEDYVLAKRRALVRLGWPASVLLITVVRDKDGDGHAVLTVVTDRGDLVLDNQAAPILPWHETGYRFVKRQSQGDPALWVSLGETRSPPVVGGGR
ncbi:transglutaminase-like cysteine peptidase [Aquabacter spiritensis]|uniref:Putative transglutaminase-like cysteine proteinase n=1 Tax=Aquabacter spiritensis TaxID=933073 RepID=A0A4R3M5F2_9HYPH|nr:transglutaminase-like cysteine peptidase [Aquabacter spiritensis]TCT07813.1 putative transglutaminase-like cysteine proteinase [Aquabacter spiritensis]